MRLSIIIPVYLVAPYIERCLASVMQQEVSDVECLLIDDGGKDNSIKVAKQFLVDYTGPITFRFLTHPSNRGLSAARNTGIEAATGAYVLFLDGDDALTPGALTALLNTATAHPDVDIVQGNTTVEPEYITLEESTAPAIKVDKHQYSLHANLPDYTNQQSWLIKALLERKLIPVTSWNKLIRRTWLVDNNLWFKEGLFHEDEHWTFFAASQASSLAFCKVITYVHYIREGSIMRLQADRSILSWFDIINDMVTHLEEPEAGIKRKVVLEVSFCNLVRIVVKGSKQDLTDRLAEQRRLLQPLQTTLNPRNKWLERWLLSWFRAPLWLLKILCRPKIKGLYLRTLDFYKP